MGNYERIHGARRWRDPPLLLGNQMLGGLSSRFCLFGGVGFCVGVRGVFFVERVCSCLW